MNHGESKIWLGGPRTLLLAKKDLLHQEGGGGGAFEWGKESGVTIKPSGERSKKQGFRKGEWSAACEQKI